MYQIMLGTLLHSILKLLKIIQYNGVIITIQETFFFFF